MKLLALDTATEACSAAVYIDGNITSRFAVAPRRHAELILPMIDECLGEAGVSLAQLDAIAYGCGPGAFTGLRIAAGVAQGLAFAHDRPLIPVSSLATLAWSVRDKATQILPAIDARMQEIYCALYQTTPAFKLLQDERVCLPDETGLTVTADCYGVGTGWGQYDKPLRRLCAGQLSDFAVERYPDASQAVHLAVTAWNNNELQRADEVAPSYLRNKVTG